jgi:hypothetical protein
MVVIIRMAAHRRRVALSVKALRNVQNAIDRLLHRHHASPELSRGGSFIASRFDEMDRPMMRCIDYSILGLILSSSEWKVDHEDELCQQISSLAKLDRNDFDLFQYVEFEYISAESAN